MDKLTAYQNTIIKVLTAYYDFLCRSTTIGATEVRDELVTDTQHNHFQLITLGWQGKRFFHETHLHLDIIGEKIWIQQNNTELDIIEELLLQGVEKQHIVLGFLSPSMRAQTGFAVA